MSSKRRDADSGDEDPELASSSDSASEGEGEGEGEESKSGGESKTKAAAASSGGSGSGKRALAPFTMTEEEEEADWNTARDEAEEAAALKAALSGQKPAKKRRIQKVADLEDAAHKPASYRSLLADEDDVDDFVVDDTGDYGLDKDDDFGVRKDKKMLEAIAVQGPFQPGSTPPAGTGEARFLSYNLVGNITSLEEQSGSDDKIHIVQLNYTDTTKHKASKFRDFFGFKIAAMGAHGAVFASPRGWDKKEKKELPSTIFFRPSDSWDSKATSEWTLHLDVASKEEALLVAVGDTFVGVATSKQYVRLISHTGIQQFVLSLPGPVVSMAASASSLALVFHDGVPLPGHQNLGLIVLDCVKRKELYRGKCVISPRATLTWIGFSDVNMLLCMDSFGVIRALGRSWDWAWTPVFDSALLKSTKGSGSSSAPDVVWPVSVMEDKLMCLVLADGRRHPTAGKRSAQSLQTLQLQLPFLGLDQPVAQHEELHARHSLLWHNDLDGGHLTASRFYSSKQEVAQDKLVLALFQRAAKGDFLARALDLATMLYKKKSLEVATQMAVFEKKTALVSRLHMLLSVKFPARAAPDDDDDGFAAFLDGSASNGAAAAAATSSGPRRKLIRPGGAAVSFADAAEENARGDADDGEAEYDFGASTSASASAPRSSMKPGSQSSAAGAAGAAPAPFSSGSLSIRAGQKVQSANVKTKVAGTQPSPKKTNPFANKQ